MALIVLCNPRYRPGVWCDAKIRGITEEASRRRIQPQFFTDINAAKAFAQRCDSDSSVILLFDAIDWLSEAVLALSTCNPHIILSANFIDFDLPVSYSIVGTDVDAAMRTAVDYLHACGKHRIALVGANANSCNDRSRAAMLKKYLPDEECRIFYADGNMTDCFEEFSAVQNEFDAAFCTNDFIAICLEEHLSQYRREGEKLFIISHTDTVMARLYGDGITSITTNFFDCGRMLVEAHFNRLKYGFASSSILLPAQLKVRGSTDNIPYVKSNEAAMPMPTTLPERKKLILPTGDVSRLERTLASSDLINLKIMYCLLCDLSYDKMGEFCFISAETARYRVRKIRDALNLSKKTEAADFLGKYIKKEKLLAVISEHEERNNKIISDL